VRARGGIFASIVESILALFRWRSSFRDCVREACELIDRCSKVVFAIMLLPVCARVLPAGA